MGHHFPSELSSAREVKGSLCPVFLQAVPNIHLVAFGADTFLLNSEFLFSLTAGCANRKLSFWRSAILPLFMCIKLIQECVFPINFKIQEFRVALWCSALALAQTQYWEGILSRNIHEGENENELNQKLAAPCFIILAKAEDFRGLLWMSFQMTQLTLVGGQKEKGRPTEVICGSYFWVWRNDSQIWVWQFLWTTYSISLFCDFCNLSSSVCKLLGLSSFRQLSFLLQGSAAQRKQHPWLCGAFENYYTFEILAINCTGNKF